MNNAADPDISLVRDDGFGIIVHLFFDIGDMLFHISHDSFAQGKLL